MIMQCAGTMCEVGQPGLFRTYTPTMPAIELPAVSKAVTKCRKLVGHFKHSVTLIAEMGVHQKAMTVPEHSLVQDVATMWNSTFEIMALTDILLDTSVTKSADAAST